MASISSSILQATSCLCSSRGSMTLQQLHHHLQQRCSMTQEDFLFIIRGCPERFQLVPDGSGSFTVVARTSVRLCRSYGRGEPCSGCRELHLCRFYIYGTCRFGKGRKPCKFSHDIQSNHNFRLLRECTLHELKEEELFLLLLQNDPQLLPEVCLHYNKGSGPDGCCSFQSSCTKVHLCQYFVQGTCTFGSKCKRQHVIGQQRNLEERGLMGGVIQDLPFIYRNIFYLTSAPPSPDAAAKAECFIAADQAEKMKDICLHFLRNSCRFLEQCHRVHFHLPYKWEVLSVDAWTELPNMEDIERDYCDPSKTRSNNPPVDFVTMRLESLPVRRLSTVSSVTKPPHYSLTTCWLWYYRGDHGNWVEYGQLDNKQQSTSVTSQSLEEKYLSDKTAKVNVVRGQRAYVICFKDMYQRNPKHKTKRRVCRRPRFVSRAEVDRLLAEDRKRSG